MSRPMNIGEAAEAAGLSAKMIRHYEQIGLVPAAARTDAGYRQYTDRDVSILRFIRQSRRLGFSMQQIAELLGLWSDTRRASRMVKSLARQHAADLEEKIREMAAMKDALDRLIEACHGDDRPHCRILDGLAPDGSAHPTPTASNRTAVAGRLGRKPASNRTPRRQAPAAEPASFLDLMAWTAKVRRAAPRA
jgi:Cu(I)-responsive transcriptional regulator